MTSVSEFFNLQSQQESLEFVDVDVEHDQAVFLDPAAIRFAGTPLSHTCVSLLQSFFDNVLQCVVRNDRAEGVRLLGSLNETSETRLGFSASGRRGHGMGPGIAEELWSRLRQSRAATSGSLQDLEESTLFIRKIGEDVVSDLITNICRKPLAEFTAEMAAKYSMPLQEVRAIVWSREGVCWEEQVVTLPVVDGEPLVLVPRTFVRIKSVFDPSRFYRHYALPVLQDREMTSAGRGLVRVLKSGEIRPPTKKAIAALNPDVKDTNDRIASEEEGLLDSFRQDVEVTYALLDHNALRGRLGREPVDWDALLRAVTKVPPGSEDASNYHQAVENLLNALLFEMGLTDPVHEFSQNQGRKRVDIDYRNSARSGFFHWLHSTFQVPCPFVPVECKNYSKDLKNPEIDQLLGRFSINRGRFGILCHRGFGDADLLLQRCQDAASKRHDYVLTLDDDELVAMVDLMKADQSPEAVFIEKFRVLTS